MCIMLSNVLPGPARGRRRHQPLCPVSLNLVRVSLNLVRVSLNLVRVSLNLVPRAGWERSMSRGIWSVPGVLHRGARRPGTRGSVRDDEGLGRVAERRCRKRLAHRAALLAAGNAYRSWMLSGPTFKAGRAAGPRASPVDAGNPAFPAATKGASN